MIDYQINKNFYEIHCVNKAKPEMNCHGKCQMQKESEKSSNPFNLVKYSFEFNILPAKPLEFSFKNEGSFVDDSTIFNFRDATISDVFLDILPHPPQI